MCSENMAMRPEPRKWTNYTDDTVSLFHADISQGYDSDRKEKGDGSTDVPNRERDKSVKG